MRSKRFRSSYSLAPALFLLAVTATPLAAQAHLAEAPGRQNGSAMPNVLLLYSDDTSYYLAGPYGDRLAVTPSIDRLADQGVLIEQGFSNALFCKPARNSLFASWYPHQHGWLTNSVQIGGATPATYLTQELGDAGYDTHGIGKWHSAWSTAEVGFDSFQIVDHDQATQVRKWLENRGSDPDPWMLYVSFNLTHGPWELDPVNHEWWPRRRTHRPLRENVNSSRVNKPAAQDVFEAEGFEKLDRQGLNPLHAEAALIPYYKDAQRLDHQVGRILHMLDELGVEDETLVIFTSDQGVMAGNHYLWYKGPAAYEELTRVPMMFRWPGVIPAQSKSEVYVSTVDLAPTILDAVGLAIPAGFSGESVWPILTGQATDNTQFVICQSAMDDPLSGYIRVLRTKRNQILFGQWKLVLYQNDVDELYDLVSDPFEQNNLAQDPLFLSQYLTLRNKLVSWMNAHGDPAASAF